jgi:hypothetical protein
MCLNSPGVACTVVFPHEQIIVDADESAMNFPRANTSIPFMCRLERFSYRKHPHRPVAAVGEEAAGVLDRDRI